MTKKQNIQNKKLLLSVVYLLVVISAFIVVLSFIMTANKQKQDKIEPFQMAKQPDCSDTDICVSLTLDDTSPNELPSPDMYLCNVYSYIAIYTQNKSACRSNANGDIQVVMEQPITYTIINKLPNKKCDWNCDGNCDADDFSSFTCCINTLSNKCLFTFDWNEDKTIDLKDIASMQNGFNTGNDFFFNEIKKQSNDRMSQK